MILGHMTHPEREFIRQAVLSYQPKLLVECGTWKGGGSTLALFLGILENKLGHLYTFETNTFWYTEAVAAYQYHYPDTWTNVSFMNMDFITGLRTLNIQDIDFAMLDGNGTEPLYGLAAFKELEPRMTRPATVVAHDWNSEKQSQLRQYVGKHRIWSVAGESLQSEPGLVCLRQG